MAGTGAAFDPLASRYDELWTSAPAGRLQRDAVWRNVRACFRPHHHILDLGCGTGEDSAWLLRQGVSVTAIDASPAMVSKAREKNADARVLKVEEIDRLPGRYSGAISNFGVFNCVALPEMLRANLAARFLPGAHLAFCVMGRFCLWETLWFSMRGRFRKAGRRWRGVASADTLGISVTYHSVAGLRRALAPEFELIRIVGIGIAVPPSYVRGLPAWSFKVLASIDRLVERLPFFPALADHRLLIFKRR
jgi:SAM-dependent methyltransferase